jgi:hypothetical protein
MKTLLKIYAASCVVVFAFFLFFSLPFGLLPFSDAVNLIFAGLLVLAIPVIYFVATVRREGFDFGWLLSNRGGFWAILVGAFGLAAIFCGMLLFIWPEMFQPAFEQGTLPFGILLVSLFWLALIYMFAFLAFGATSQAAEYIRQFRFRDSFAYLLLTLICSGLAGVFVSLFLQVLNDIAIRISETNQWNAIIFFVSLLLAAGIVHGTFRQIETVTKEK